MNAAPKIEASMRAKKRMQTTPQSSVAVSSRDPWLRNDGWKGYQKTSAASEPADESEGQEVIFTENRGNNSQAAQTRLSAMEDRIMAQINKRFAELPPPGLETPPQAQLQAEITELKAQNQKFEAWFTDVGARFCGVDTQLNAQQSRMKELGAAMKETHAATQTLQRDLTAISTAFRSELQASLECQTDALSNTLRP